MQREDGNLILSFCQEKVIEKQNWKMWFLYAAFVLIWEGTGAPDE